MKSDKKHLVNFFFTLLMMFAGIFAVFFGLKLNTNPSYISLGLGFFVLGVLHEIEDIGQRIRDDIVEELKPKEN